jgi:hypothetical protein
MVEPRDVPEQPDGEAVGLGRGRGRAGHGPLPDGGQRSPALAHPV